MVRIDKTPPVTTTNAETGSQHDTFTIKMDAVDEMSGVYSTFYSINGGSFKSGNMVVLTRKGEYTVSFYSRDRAGNNEPVQTIQLTINGIEKAEDEIPVLENTGLNKEEVEKIFDFIGNDPEKIEELTNLEKNTPFPEWDPTKKNEQLPQIEEFLDGFEEITGAEINTTMDENPVTFEELTNEDKLTSDIVIEINDPYGDMLANIILLAEKVLNEALFQNEFSNNLTEIPLDTAEADNVRGDNSPTNLQENDRVFKTVIGAKLPDTESNMPLTILLGVFMMLIGAMIFIKNRKSSSTSQTE